MTIELANVVIKHERRVRLLFTASLAAGAFSSLTPYSVESLDGDVAEPLVLAAYALTSDPATVELQISTPLVEGARYRFFANAVPGLDSSTTPNPSSVDGTFGASTLATRAVGVQQTSQLDAFLYGIDLRFDGDDFAEAADGDLATIAGQPNLQAANERRAESEGLPWNPDHGIHPRQYVDSTPGGVLAMRGQAERKMRKDDRNKSVKARVETDNAKGEATCFIDVVPIGAGDLLTTIGVSLGSAR
jgi:hypothetical protein